MSPRTTALAAPAVSPVVERGEGSIGCYLYVTVNGVTFDAEIEVAGPEGCCVKMSESRRFQDGHVEDSESVLDIKTLRNDEWRAFVALMQAVFAERERLAPAVQLLKEGVDA